MENYIIVNEFLSSENFNALYNSLSKAFEKRGEEVEIISNVKAQKLLEKSGNGAPVLFFDKDVFLAKLLEKCGYRCVNSSFVIETCDDKAKTYIALKDKFLMPKTILAPFSFDNVKYSNFEFLNSVGEKLGYPLIVKENKGSFGAQVYLVNCFEELLSLVKKIGHCNILFQQFVSSSKGRDLRVYVVANKAIAYALRKNEKDFRSNVGSGGKMEKVAVRSDYLTFAEEVCACLGADFAGVDLLLTQNGPMLCEVNSNAHFNALSLVSGVDVAQKIVDYFLTLK